MITFLQIYFSNILFCYLFIEAEQKRVNRLFEMTSLLVRKERKRKERKRKELHISSESVESS